MLNHLNQALKVNPNYSDALSLRGIVHYDAQRFEAAIQDFEAALKSSPDRADIYRNLGVAYVKLGEARPALGAFQNYLKFNPQAPDQLKIQRLISELENLE